MTDPRPCAWCGAAIEIPRRDARFCGVRCRQAAWRFGRQVGQATAADRPMRFAYADPPYPGKAGLYPERREVDHAALVARLREGYPDGWALSTSSGALLDVWRLCPDARLAVWVRPIRPTRSALPLDAFEVLLIAGGRPLPTEDPQRITNVLDYRGRFRAHPDAVIGMKPPAFATWMFEQLGARAGDELVDLYPGSGAIGRAWDRFTADPSPAPGGDGSRRTSGDTSPAAEGDTSREALSDG